MSSKALIDLGCRSNFVCRSCLLALPKLAPLTASTPSPSRHYTRPARSTARASVARPIRRSKPLNTVSAPNQPLEREPEEDESENVVVRYFEQDPSGQRRAISDKEKFSDSMADESSMALREIQQLERQLKKPGGLKELARRMGLLAADGRKAPEEEFEDGDELEPDGEGEFAHAIDTSGLNVRQTRQIMQLNWNLQRAARKLKRPGKVKQKTIHDAWRLYSLARPLLQNSSWGRVPAGAWKILWDLVSWDGPENVNRMGRVYQLGKDLRAAGVPLDEDQQLLLIEAAFVENKRAEALEAWRRFVGGDAAAEAKHLRLGVRMYSIHGDVDRAKRALDKYLELPEATLPDSDARFMLHFVRACAADAARQDQAWDAYRQLRELLGHDMTIRDYDEVIATFLVAKQTETAFHVFVDMMFSGAVDVRGKTRLPSKVANHFFMGKWLKRLIGAGDLDGALSVLGFMQSKGILAAKVQVNGLIGAYLRSGVAEHAEKGEQLAWAMIKSRRTFVDLRRREALMEWPIRLLRTRQSESDGGLGLYFVPQASLETFSLMAENYRERRLHGRLEELWVAFQDCEITTDAFMLNQLLESYNHEGQGERAREVYRRLTEQHSLQPDAYTFFALYKSLAVNRLFWSAVTDEIKRDEGAVCRDLFCTMVSSSWTFSAEVSEQPQGALARMLLHSFRKCDDHVGLLVALRALHEVYGYTPSQMICMELLAETADLGRSTKKLFDVNQRMQTALEEAMAQAGGELSEEHRASVLLDLVQEHFFRKMVVGSEKEFSDMYSMAVEQMGLGDVLVDEAE